jgi:1,4-alpha-glucan branching enzyme
VSRNSKSARVSSASNKAGVATPGFDPEELREFEAGTHVRLHERLGAHLAEEKGVAGVRFAVWAPGAEAVCVMGDFNRWNRQDHPLQRGAGGIWSGFVRGVRVGATYRYGLTLPGGDRHLDKADPVAFRHESEPGTGSLVQRFEYQWSDAEWMEGRARKQQLKSPISIYQVHPGSWRRVPEEGNRLLNYRELAFHLAEHLDLLGFTHVELLPVMHHRSYDSHGFKTSGYFAPSPRQGTPEDLMYLVDLLHQRGIGVILDWVPSGFANEPEGLFQFDGTPLYEAADPPASAGLDAAWFNHARGEVRSFLLSNAWFWLDRYHADGLRVHGLSPMLYLDRLAGDPGGRVNEYGGREDLHAIEFVKKFNEIVYQGYPDIQTFADETTGRPSVSRPTYLGGLGFGFKWDSGFPQETLSYLSQNPIHRKYHHRRLTFRDLYAFTENYVLPLSHETAREFGSLLARMPGDEWQKFANLRLLLAYVFLHPGKKLLFMGTEFGQWTPWNAGTSLDWHQLQGGRMHQGIAQLTALLNHLYRRTPALHEQDSDEAGFQWVDCHDAERSTLTWLRFGSRAGEAFLAAFNFTPVPRHNVRVGVPLAGWWQEVLNTDAQEFGGSGQGNLGGVESAPFPWHGQPHLVTVTLPPLGAVGFTMRNEAHLGPGSHGEVNA